MIGGHVALANRGRHPATIPAELAQPTPVDHPLDLPRGSIYLPRQLHPTDDNDNKTGSNQNIR